MTSCNEVGSATGLEGAKRIAVRIGMKFLKKVR
jgi:hypothetical protein